MRTSTLFAFIVACFIFVNINAQVSPFLTTSWNQTCYYNDSCPVASSGGACGKTYTGCNATAMAMICKYYAYPSTGMSNHCNSNLPTQCVNFAAQTYNYSAMPNNVTSANAEVAKLMAHLGCAADMQYSGTSSNSFFDANILKRYFAYSPRMYPTATFMFATTQDLIDAIKLEMDAGRPVFCKGGNHFYLIDGYDASDNFHMNFGWGGTYNGYYAINSVVNPAGTFTPVNFIFMIRPLYGDLETNGDTIVVAATGGSQSFEFTSLLNWTISTPDSWLTPNLTSGTPGFYSFSDGATVNVAVNNGGIRYGYLFIQNANDIDTIVVQQDASPLGVTPDSLHYADVGGGQTATLTYYSWGNWTATPSAGWISVSPSSGTGNATPTISATLNGSASPRYGYVAISAGSFRDTIWIDQDGNTLGLSMLEATNQIVLFPQPADHLIFIDGLPVDKEFSVSVFSLTGQSVLNTTLLPGERSLDVSLLDAGVYIVSIRNNIEEHNQRIVIR